MTAESLRDNRVDEGRNWRGRKGIVGDWRTLSDLRDDFPSLCRCNPSAQNIVAADSNFKFRVCQVYHPSVLFSTFPEESHLLTLYFQG